MRLLTMCLSLLTGVQLFGVLLQQLGEACAQLPFAWAFGLYVAALLAYYGNERSTLHRRGFEQVFWATSYAWLAFSLTVLPGSPLVALAAWVRIRGLRDLLLVLLAAYIGLTMQQRSERGRQRSSIQHLAREQLTQVAVTETVMGRIAVSRLTPLLSSREGLHVVLDVLITGRRRRVQNAVFAILKELCTHGMAQGQGYGDLLFVLNCWEIDLPQLFLVAGTVEVVRLLQMHASHMDVLTKARLIDALQRQPDFFYLRHLQELVVDLLVYTCGEELTQLKTILDEGGDFYNLHKLVFLDLEAALRESVLQHIEGEGSELRQMISSEDSSLNSLIPTKILSDIDDTLYSSGGRFPAGSDGRYPKHEVYPGVLALFREIDRREAHKAGNEGAAVDESPRPWYLNRFSRTTSIANPIWLRTSGEEWTEISVPPTETLAALQERVKKARREGEKQQATPAKGHGDISFQPPRGRVMSNLVFLSARPHAYKDYSESASYRLFRRLRKRGVLHCMPTLLAGQLSASAGAALRGLVIMHRFKLGIALLALFAADLWGRKGVLHFTYALWLLFLAVFGYGAVVTRRLPLQVVWRPVGDAKVCAFGEYSRLYSECDTVFFGDNGQGDLWCAEHIAPQNEVARQGSGPAARHLAAFIHEVLPRGEQLSSLAPMSEERRNGVWQSRKIFFHRTYVGAAINAHRCGLIFDEGLSRVGRAAVEELVRMRIAFADSDHPWDTIVAELNADVERANMILPDGVARIEPVPLSLSRGVARQSFAASPSIADFSFYTDAPRPERVESMVSVT